MTHAKFVVLVLMALLGAAMSVAPAHAQGHVNFDLPAQSLAKSLRAIANQSSTNVLFDQKLVDGLRAPALKAQLTPREAIARLLAGTGVVFEFVNEHTVVLAASTAALEERKGSVEQTSHATPPQTRADSSALQLARADETQAAVRKKAEESAEVSVDEKGIPEMLIRGKRTSNTDIQRTEDDIQPYVTFDAEDLKRSGAGNLEDFLKTRLPMNSVQATNAQSIGAPYGNQSQVNLRGLGTNQTLVLVNGRRMPSVSAFSITTTGFSQPDINGIPMATVERIEVLPSTASGIYGGGATGGVLNIILKRDYTGAELRGTYDNVFDGDYAQRKLDGSAGFSLQDGKTNVQFTAGYSDANRLLAGERDFANRALALQLQNNPDFGVSPFSPPVGRTPNIGNANGTDLIFAASGISLGEPVTYVPEGYAGVSSDGGAALARNAGHYNLASGDDIPGRGSALLSNPTIKSAGANLRREFGERFEVFLDAALYDNKSLTSSEGLSSFVFLDAGMPNNPFTDPIYVVFHSPGGNLPLVSNSRTRQVAAGGIVRLPRSWTAQAEYSWSRARFNYLSFNPALTSDGFAALENGDLDIVRDLNLYPLDYAPFLFDAPPSIFGPADTVMQDGTVRFAGPGFNLPAGPLNLTALFERRQEEAQDFIREDNFSGFAPSYTYQPSRVQRVQSMYAEGTVPLISSRNAWSFVKSLDIQLSARRDEYTTTVPATSGVPLPSRSAPTPTGLARITNTVESTDYTVGLRFSPMEDLTLRASYGTGFLPPSIAQLFPAVTASGAIFAADPKRDNVRTGLFPVRITRGGNPGLTPESSASTSAGAIFTPRALPGLRLSVDYTRIRKTDEINNFLFQEILDNEDFLPGRVTRATLTQADINAGFTGGVITEINSSAANISRTELEAFDLNIDYSWQTSFGTFSFYSLSSYQPHLKRRILPTSVTVDRVGYLDGPVKWRGNAGVTLERDAWAVGWNTQFYDSYLVYQSFTPAVAVPDIVFNQGAATVPAQSYSDLYAKYRLSDSPFAYGVLSNVEVVLTIQNVFNKIPPTIATTVADGGYSLYGDPRLRRYTISATKRF